MIKAHGRCCSIARLGSTTNIFGVCVICILHECQCADTQSCHALIDPSVVLQIGLDPAPTFQVKVPAGDLNLCQGMFVQMPRFLVGAYFSLYKLCMCMRTLSVIAFAIVPQRNGVAKASITCLGHTKTLYPAPIHRPCTQDMFISVCFFPQKIKDLWAVFGKISVRFPCQHTKRIRFSLAFWPFLAGVGTISNVLGQTFSLAGRFDQGQTVRLSIEKVKLNSAKKVHWYISCTSCHE